MFAFDEYLRWGPLRWPPRASTSIESGLIGYFVLQIHILGQPPEAAAESFAEGYTEFWLHWGETGLLIGFALFVGALLYIALARFWRSWMMIGRLAV